LFSKIATVLISPLGTALLLAVLAAFCVWRRRTAWAKTFGVVAFAWLYFWSTPWASVSLCAGLEGRTPMRAATQFPQADAIVVLGGAVAPAAPGFPAPDLGRAADRVWFAAQLYKAGKAPIVLLSGGGDPRREKTPEATAMTAFLTDLGVPRTAIWQEPRSRSTHENARQVARWAASLPARPRLLLVTSAMHMPRALLEFRAAGLAVVPAATDYEARSTPPGVLAWLPDAEATFRSTLAFKELVGWAVAMVRVS